jgi:arginase family enzyme
MDLVEVSPPNDIQGITSFTAATIILHFLGGLAAKYESQH